MVEWLHYKELMIHDKGVQTRKKSFDRHHSKEKCASQFLRHPLGLQSFRHSHPCVVSCHSESGLPCGADRKLPELDQKRYVSSSLGLSDPSLLARQLCSPLHHQRIPHSLGSQLACCSDSQEAPWRGPHGEEPIHQHQTASSVSESP